MRPYEQLKAIEAALAAKAARPVSVLRALGKRLQGTDVSHCKAGGAGKSASLAFRR